MVNAMRRVIRAAEIELKHLGTGRDIGRALGQIVCPHDVIDFEGLITTTNSFADEFIVTFLKHHSSASLKTLKFRNASPLLKSLLKRAIIRRTREQIIIPYDFKTQGQRITPISTNL